MTREARSSNAVIFIVPLLLPAFALALALLTQDGAGAKVVTDWGLLEARGIAFDGGALLSVPCAPAVLVISIRHWRRGSEGMRIFLALASVFAAFPLIAIAYYFYALTKISG